MVRLPLNLCNIPILYKTWGYITMSNEEIVAILKNNMTAANMQILYENNLPLITIICKPYSSIEPLEDLLQESYFGLCDAVQDYEPQQNAKFMTYAQYKIKAAVQRYIENCGYSIRIPTHRHNLIVQYKRTESSFVLEHGRKPTDKEIAHILHTTVEAIKSIQPYLQGVHSLDMPLITDNGTNTTMGDTVADAYCLEDEAIENIHEDNIKIALWDIVDRYTNEQENKVIQAVFKENKTLSEVGRETNNTPAYIRTTRDKGLRRLRASKALREIKESCEVLEASTYRCGISKFKQYGDTSTVEYMAIRRMELESRLNSIKAQ